MIDFVVVLMSSFNGERYIGTQIESILHQKKVNTLLIIRDDGSTDNTVSIIKNYQKTYDNIQLIEGPNIGCKASFFELCRYAQQNIQKKAYFAFADQDDYWLPEKLYQATIKLSCIQQDKPILYFCPTTPVDKNLNVISENIASDSGNLTFAKLCISKIASGCTMVFNKISLILFLLGQPNIMSMHDCWMFYMVPSCGGIIINDNNSYIYYRQHSNNVIGAKNNRFDTFKRRLKTLFNRDRQRSTELKYIINTYKDYIDPSKINTLTLLTEYNNSITKKLKLLFNRDYSWISDFYFKLAVILNVF